MRTVARFIKFNLVLLMACLALTQTAVAQSSCEGTFAPKRDIDQIMHLLFYTKTLVEGAKNRFFDQMWESPKFQAFLEKRGARPSENPSESEKYQLLSVYVESYLNRFKDPTLVEKIQESVALKGLVRHGIDVRPNESAQNARVRNSSRNLKEMADQYELSFSPSQDVEIEQALANIEMVAIHNSHNMTEPPNFPLLAPRAIEGLGIKDFGMSTLPFNRELGSDQFVYFRALFKVTNGQAGARSEYGRSGVVLKKQYADEHILISAFVMYEPNLLDAISKSAPELVDAWKYGPPVGRPTISNLQAQLRKSDYTAKDFEILIKSILRRELLKIKEQDHLRYSQLIRDMNDSQADIRKLSKSLYTLTGSYFHNTNDAFEFEGVVPAVVPETALVHFN